jgi:hypothetical protein
MTHFLQNLRIELEKCPYFRILTFFEVQKMCSRAALDPLTGLIRLAGLFQESQISHTKKNLDFVS